MPTVSSGPPAVFPTLTEPRNSCSGTFWRASTARTVRTNWRRKSGTGRRRYHFSPIRSNLLRPLRIRPGMRVLEIGCGTGAITRWLGEQHAQVVAIEGNIRRARAAAVRCEGLASVEIVAGTLDDVPPDALFDLVVVVGVLEYSTVFLHPEAGPWLFLRDHHPVSGRPGNTLPRHREPAGVEVPPRIRGGPSEPPLGRDRGLFPYLGSPDLEQEGTRRHAPRAWG